jgi:hypothetical protein
MKLARRVLAVAIAFSLLLSLGCAAMWVRGYWAYDTWSFGDAGARSETGLLASTGRLMAWRVTKPPADGPPTDARRGRFGYPVHPGFRHIARRPTSIDAHWFGGPQNDWNRAGFGYYARDLHGDWWRCLFLPWWALCLITALPPATWVRSRLRNRRPRTLTPASPAGESPAPQEPRPFT